jgi:hypothetical protein
MTVELELEDLARSAAASGNDAAALLQIREGEKKVRKTLKGNLVTFQCEDISEYDQKTKVLSTIIHSVLINCA